MHPFRAIPAAILLAILPASLALAADLAEPGAPVLYRKLRVPDAFTDGLPEPMAGDVRIGDLTGDGRADFVLGRARGGSKFSFLGAIGWDGKPLWQAGSGGGVPARPGPLAVHDIDADGDAEVICIWLPPDAEPGEGMENAVLQIRHGRTGEVERQAAPEAFRRRRPGGALSDWVHQRILIANLRGLPTPRDFVIKLGDRVLAFDQDLELLWTYEVRWTKYGRHTAYIPAVGDADGDGRDEVTGGLYLLDHDGRPLWERFLARHMDSVAIVPWDDGRRRVVASGFGTVADEKGELLFQLGDDLVPHGQEVRVADFLADEPGPEMVVRCRGHRPHVLLVNNRGQVLERYRLNNFPPKNVGMEPVYWKCPDRPALLYNGGQLWHPRGKRFARLPQFPATDLWSFCIPADVCGDRREDLLIYDPARPFIYIYSPGPVEDESYAGYQPGPRQYNARLMD